MTLPETSELSHLNAIDLRLSHERARVSQAKTDEEREWRQHSVRMTERERDQEIAFLARRGIIVTEEQEMTLDEIITELGLQRPTPRNANEKETPMSKQYVCTYQHEGRDHGVNIFARDEADASRRLRAIGTTARVEGELVAEIPAGNIVGFFANAVRRSIDRKRNAGGACDAS